MIQKGTCLNVADNSGAKIVYFIQNISVPSSRYAFQGNIILVGVKRLRTKRRYASKIKKGALAYALILRTKYSKCFFWGDTLYFYENAVILFYRNTFKLIGTRIFGFISFLFRRSQFMRILSICTGVAS